jgi:nitric oxide dioxygenase
VRKLDFIDVLALLLIVIGAGLFAYGLSLEPPSSLEELVLTQFGDWTPGFVMDGVLLLIINSVIHSHEQRRVISQVGSLSNEFALDAVRLCRDEGWLQSGIMQGRRFESARLGGADLSDSKLSGAIFSFADLSAADLTYCDLKGVDLKGANLHGADLRWADLSRASLQWADLRGANLAGAKLDGVKADYAAGDSGAIRFYERLFETAPNVRKLFPDDVEQQARKFLQALRVIVSSLSSTERAARVLKRLGDKHHGYGAETDHYSVVGTVLVETLQDVLGDDFSDEASEAWTAAYRLISSIMISASELQ